MLQAIINGEIRVPGHPNYASPVTRTDLLNKTRMIVRKGTGYIVLRIEDIVLFYTENKMTYVIDSDTRKYISEKNLCELESMLNSNLFFRANRQYILNIDFIKSYRSFEKVKLQVDLNLPGLGHSVIVSQETAPHFREWMSQA